MQNNSFSPGPISNNEILLRLIFSPDHIHEDGTLKTEAISRRDLTERGFSLFRKKYVTVNKLLKVIEEYIENKNERKCEGISQFVCETVLSITDEAFGEIFQILEDANTEDDLAHAIIKFSPHLLKCKDFKPATQKKFRSELIKKLENIIKTEIIFREISGN